MAILTDIQGQAWPFEITIQALEDIQKLHGIDLEKLVVQGGAAATDFVASPRTVLTVASALCGMSDEQAHEFVRKSPAKIVREARYEILRAVADFCLPPSAAEKYAQAVAGATGMTTDQQSSTAEAGSSGATTTAG
jgi:hypothetical protein